MPVVKTNTTGMYIFTQLTILALYEPYYGNREVAVFYARKNQNGRLAAWQREGQPAKASYPPGKLYRSQE